MAKTLVAPGPEILQAALQGLELQRNKLDEQIAQVRALLGRKGPGRPARAAASGVIANGVALVSKRVLSPEARKRIATAQKKRWAAFRKSKNQ